MKPTSIIMALLALTPMAVQACVDPYSKCEKHQWGHNHCCCGNEETMVSCNRIRVVHFDTSLPGIDLLLVHLLGMLAESRELRPMLVANELWPTCRWDAAGLQEL